MVESFHRVWLKAFYAVSVRSAFFAVKPPIFTTKNTKIDH